MAGRDGGEAGANAAAAAPAGTAESMGRAPGAAAGAGDAPQLTVRAVATGGLIGMLMAIGNVYATMKVGIGFGVALSACIISFMAWGLLRAVSAGRVRPMSLLESNCMQSTASAAGFSTGSTLSITFAALLMLDPAHRQQPWWVIALYTFATATMGVFMAVPFRRVFIDREGLPFPSGTAAATTLRNLYAHRGEAMRSAYALLGACVAGAVSAVLGTAESQFAALGRFFAWMRAHAFDVHLPAQWPEQGFGLIAGKPVVGFGFSPDLLVIGAGMLVGPRVALSMVFASTALYVGIAPWLHASDVAQQGAAGYVVSLPLVGGGKLYHPLRWSVWGGASIMVFSSLAALALHWRDAARALGAPGLEAAAAWPGAHEAREIPRSWMAAGVIAAAAGLVALQVGVFDVAWWAGIIAVLMSFVLCAVAARATGETDFSPVGALGKIMQLLFALLAPPAVVGAQASVAQNVVAAGIAANSAGASADLLTDLKSGHLLGANPRRQFLAQFAGVFFGTLICVPVWFLLVPDIAALDKYPLPAAQVWVATARALTGGLRMLPASVLYAVVAGAVLGIGLPLLGRAWPRSRAWLPSPMGLGLGWVVPFGIALSFAVGALLRAAWRLAAPGSEARHAVPVASGLIAGASIVSALLAMLATALGLAA